MLDRALFIVTFVLACLVLDTIFSFVSKPTQAIIGGAALVLYVWKGKKP